MNVILDPIVQHGFLGLCGLQLAVGVWLVRRLVEMAQAMSGAAAAQADAVRNLERRLAEIAGLLGDLRDRILLRPCLRPKNP